ncbi:MAG: glycosyltransferase, partial [Sinomicrobium sp.]|nr:glycosyltransferase [Sinomicrobium sp.]
MTVLLITILALYVALIGGFAIGFGRMPVFTKKVVPPVTKFSVIVPFRNEAENLIPLLESLKELDYPTEFFEVLFVDDASEDGSVNILKRFFANTQNEIKILTSERKSDSPKKDAIKTAVKQAKYDWIVTTDADCILPGDWLSTFNAYIIEKQPDFIAAPVSYAYGSSFLEQFQVLDLLSLQGATIGAFGMHRPFLCNGANLCYRKKVFYEVNGYAGNTDIASGDDIFLMEKILKKYPDK